MGSPSPPRRWASRSPPSTITPASSSACGTSSRGPGAVGLELRAGGRAIPSCSSTRRRSPTPARCCTWRRSARSRSRPPTRRSLWITYLAPGLTAWLLLRRVLGSGWLALPGAFVVLTLSLWPALMSGVEGGVHVGMAPARLGWALLPLLALSAPRWIEGAAPFPARSGGARSWRPIVLTHPAHLPAALVLVAIAALGGAPGARGSRAPVAWLVARGSLTAFWTAAAAGAARGRRARSPGARSRWPACAATLRDHPLAVVLILLAAVALATRPAGAFARLLARLSPALAVVVALDALVLEPRRGSRGCPPTGCMDGFWLALVLGRRPRRRPPARALARAVPPRAVPRRPPSRRRRARRSPVTTRSRSGPAPRVALLRRHRARAAPAGAVDGAARRAAGPRAVRPLGGAARLRHGSGGGRTPT